MVVAVNPEDGPAAIREFLQSHRVSDVDVVLDPGSDVTRAFLAPGFPTTYFVDRNGIVQYRRFGEAREEHLRTGLERTL